MQCKEGYIAIYSRKSKFTGKGESIGNQVDLCRAYVRNLLGEDALSRCIVFEDEGFSGGNLDRPALRRMLEAVRKGNFRAIVVYRLDRISRNISDFTGLIDELTRRDVSFISIREQFDTGTPMGRAMMFIISVFSQLERETIAERIRDNMRELAKTGRWLGGNTPTGFRSGAVSKITVDGKERKSHKLIPIPGEMEIPRQIFDLYTQKDSLTAVEAELIRQRIKTRQGKDFSRFAIKAILQNPVYMVADEAAYHYFVRQEAEVCFPKDAFDGSCGIMAYNRTDQEKGSGSRLQPVSRWIIAIGKHPGIIPSGQWIRVQESLERNGSGAYRKPRSNQALLTGLLYCSCGGRMYPKLSQRRLTSGELAYTYVCRMKERSKGSCCGRKNLNGNMLDAAVLEQTVSLKIHEGRFFSLLADGQSACAGHQDRYTRQLEGLQAERSKHERMLAGLMDSLGMADTSAAKSHILRRMEELSEMNRELESRILELEEEMAVTMISEEEFALLQQALTEFSTCMKGASVEEKRSVVRSLVHRVIWDGETVRVVLYGAVEPAPARKSPQGEGSK